VQVVLARLAVVRPHPALVARERLGQVGVLGPLVGPHVPVAVGRGRVGPGRLEPRVLVRGVVHDEVDDDAHAPVVCGAHHFHELPQRAQPGVDAVEVADVVAVVPVRRRVEGHEPQGRHADPGQVVDPVDEAGHVAHAVAVPVEVGLDVEAVHDPVLPPLVAGEGDAHRATSSGRTSAPTTVMPQACPDGGPVTRRPGHLPADRAGPS
jgi:hypothetical protein